MTMTNVVLTKLYPEYSGYSTIVSNALLVGQIIGMIVVGLTCDILGRKAAITATTLVIMLGGILATAANAGTPQGLFWFASIQNNLGKRWTFIVAAICGVAGILVTYFFVPDILGEDLANENTRFRDFLVKNGWNGDMGDRAEGDFTVPRKFLEADENLDMEKQ
ncbi:hypothetical protein M427DRAFT_76187 [Gonapodya prolifera JEL478]|uniref:Major facilitator superfamily (MFS) profile domain-containing protein n=1 Tax=Gonapodya prolifera (strain JEL478) TaxID=1344416 RepID=A0A138ZWB3_GONPJ|nr:hypothetical protein M427DRAFT_76187 [Gonapodya prolifera JEL478]|eukprot:KXS08799.1 hypothetical protein M427DRAFT_76187 [Gonapodya prolifera JEL478]